MKTATATTLLVLAVSISSCSASKSASPTSTTANLDGFSFTPQSETTSATTREALTTAERNLCTSVGSDFPKLRDGQADANSPGLVDAATGGGGSLTQLAQAQLISLNLTTARAALDGKQLATPATDLGDAITASQKYASQQFVSAADAAVLGQQLVNVLAQCAAVDEAYLPAAGDTRAADAGWQWVSGETKQHAATGAPPICVILRGSSPQELTTRIETSIPAGAPPEVVAVTTSFIELAALYNCSNKIAAASAVRDQVIADRG